MEKTLVILKPSTIQRRLIGEIVNRFERKGLILIGLKMIWLKDRTLNKHYSHLQCNSFFQEIKKSMIACPVIVCCWKGVEAIRVVRSIVGSTNSRKALPGTIRGDYSMSIQENIIHASESFKDAEKEIARFFNKKELFDYHSVVLSYLYANHEI